MNQTGTLNYQWAFSLIHHFSQLGIIHAVISPGSRSTPLALACEKHPDMTTWIQIDERSAGFFALGLAQKQHRPVILICTSGSAVANWFPAVVEANHSYTPLLLLSADRPEELQNCGANQTIDQKSLFTSHVRKTFSLDDASEVLLQQDYLKNIAQQAFQQSIQHKPGPVHINIPFREPLLPGHLSNNDLNHFIHQLGENILLNSNNPFSANENSLMRDIEPAHHKISAIELRSLCETMNSGQGLIICGCLNIQEQTDFNQLLVNLTKKLNCPALIDPLSNARFTTLDKSYFIYNYDHFLKNQKIIHTEFKPDWVIRFGQFPVSKNLMLYLQSLDCPAILISSYGDTLDPIHKSNIAISCLPGEFCQQILAMPLQTQDDAWINLWQSIEKTSAETIHQSITNNAHLFEGQVIHTLLKNLPDNSFIFSGNSMAIRDFDTFITHQSARDKNLDFFANRGVSGIDGNLSTFFGLLASQSAHNRQYGVALLGDLTFYHDMNGLLICQQLSALDLDATIILVNNSGGGIFNYLPQQQLDSFNKLWKTDTGLDFQYSAKLYGLNYTKINNREKLEEQLPVIFSLSGIQLVEVIINQETSVEYHRKI